MNTLNRGLSLLLTGILCGIGSAAETPQPAPRKTAETSENAAAFFAPVAAGVAEAPALRIADLTGGDRLLMAYCGEAAGVLGWSIEIFRCKNAAEASGKVDAIVFDEKDAIRPEAGQCCLEYAAIPVLVAVSPNLPIASISCRDLKRIYSGRVSYWDEIDRSLPHLAIRRLTPDPQSPCYRAFALVVMGQPGDGSEPAFGDAIFPGTIPVADWQTAAALLPSLKGAIAFGAWQPEPPKGCVFLPIEGVRPERSAIAAARYPAVLRRYAIVPQGGVAERLFLQLRDPALPRYCQLDSSILFPLSGEKSGKK